MILTHLSIVYIDIDFIDSLESSRKLLSLESAAALPGGSGSSHGFSNCPGAPGGSLNGTSQGIK